MTSIAKKCLLAALVAAGLVTSSGSASAAFQLVFTPISGLAGAVAQTIVLDAGPGNVNKGPFDSTPPAPATPILLYQDVAGGRRLEFGYDDISFQASGPRIQVGPVVGDVIDPINGGAAFSYNGTGPSSSISFRLDLFEDAATPIGNPGDLLTIRGGFRLFGNAGVFSTSNVNASATITQPGQNPNPQTIGGAPAPLLPGGILTPIVSSNFTRGTGSLNAKLQVSAIFTLEGYTNGTIRGFAEIVPAPAVPAPAGLILAGLGLPALSLAARLRRKSVA